MLLDELFLKYILNFLIFQSLLGFISKQRIYLNYWMTIIFSENGARKIRGYCVLQLQTSATWRIIREEGRGGKI